MRRFLDAEVDLTVVSETTGAAETLSKVAALHPDVVLIDSALPGARWDRVVARIGEAQPQARCVVIASRATGVPASPAPETVAAVLPATLSGRRLVEAVRRAASGARLPATGGATAAGAPAEAPVAPARVRLTGRQERILGLIAAGLSNREIAERLGVSEKTVKNHISGLFARLGVKRRTQAAVYALRGELVQPSAGD